MTTYFDDLETRSADEREAAQMEALRTQLRAVQGLRGYRDSLGLIDPSEIDGMADLAVLPVLRKSASNISAVRTQARR